MCVFTASDLRNGSPTRSFSFYYDHLAEAVLSRGLTPEKRAEIFSRYFGELSETEQGVFLGIHFQEQAERERLAQIFVSGQCPAFETSLLSFKNDVAIVPEDFRAFLGSIVYAIEQLPADGELCEKWIELGIMAEIFKDPSLVTPFLINQLVEFYTGQMFLREQIETYFNQKVIPEAFSTVIIGSPRSPIDSNVLNNHPGEVAEWASLDVDLTLALASNPDYRVPQVSGEDFNWFPILTSFNQLVGLEPGLKRKLDWLREVCKVRCNQTFFQMGLAKLQPEEIEALVRASYPSKRVVWFLIRSLVQEKKVSLLEVALNTLPQDEQEEYLEPYLKIVESAPKPGKRHRKADAYLEFFSQVKLESVQEMFRNLLVRIEMAALDPQYFDVLNNVLKEHKFRGNLLETVYSHPKRDWRELFYYRIKKEAIMWGQIELASEIPMLRRASDGCLDLHTRNLIAD
jgi:hypothetical protein